MTSRSAVSSLADARWLPAIALGGPSIGVPRKTNMAVAVAEENGAVDMGGGSIPISVDSHAQHAR